MGRINLSDSVIDIMVKMSEGNPGAMQALAEVLKHGSEIDPQGMPQGFGVILGLDAARIYGTDVYVLWNDKCGRDVRKMMLLLRAVQLGFVEGRKLQELAADQMREKELSEEEWDEIDEKVCGRLEQFQKRPVCEETK